MQNLAESLQQSGRGKGFWRRNWGNVVGVALSTGTVAWMLKLLSSTAQPSPHESAYQAVILTAASIFASWFLGRIHAHFIQDESIRSLGAQVAQGIILLSNQIDDLVQWVANQKASVSDAPTAAVFEHIQESLRALRSMSILALGALSDVIGGQIRRFGQIQTKISELQDEQLEETDVITNKLDQATAPNDVATLRKELHDVRDSYERKITELTRMLELPLLTRPPASPSLEPRPQAPQAELIRKALRRKQALLAPNEALLLVRLFSEADSGLQNDGSPRTPKLVYERVLIASSSLTPPVPGKQVSRFFSLLYGGRIFQFPAGVVPAKTEAYINSLDYQTVLATYIRSCIWRIWGFFTFGAGSAPLVAEVLLGSTYPDGEQITARAFEEVSAALRRAT